MNERTNAPTTFPETREERLSTADMARAANAQQQVDTPQEIRQPAGTMPGKDLEQPPLALFTKEETENFRRRWTEIQTGFVDEPRRAVEEADSLVAEVMKRLAETFASERTTLENQWNRGANVSTEDLRLALQRYRSFFHRLLSLQ